MHPAGHQPKVHSSSAQSTQRLRDMVTWRESIDASSAPAQARLLQRHAQMRTTVLPSPSWLPAPQPNECFANTVAALSRPQARTMTYVEGYAYLAQHDMAYEHAWLEDEDGNVIETTWPTPAQAYLGLEVPPSTLVDLLALDDCAPFLFGDWARGFALLREHAQCCELGWRREA